MRNSDWSSDVCSSDLAARKRTHGGRSCAYRSPAGWFGDAVHPLLQDRPGRRRRLGMAVGRDHAAGRSEEHTSELQSLMRISYAVFCLKKKIKKDIHTSTNPLTT